MTVDLLLLRVRAVWADLTGASVQFPPRGGVRVVVSPRSGLCPPSWVGVVLLGGSAIVTAPNEQVACRLRAVLPTLPVGALTDRHRIRAALPVVSVDGPARLQYVDSKYFRPARREVSVEALPPEHADLAAFLTAATGQDAARSGLARATSVFVVRVEGTVVAAGGYCRWPGGVAHLSVMTAAKWRGRGLASAVVSAATADALARRLLPQATAVPDAACRMLSNLGFRELGARLDIRLAA
jgi:RimJ/RimL family protein N-acetyltransferase